VYSIGSTLLGTLPFSRKHESEADEIGLILMSIAGYDPDEAVAFWTRMSEASDGLDFEFLSTHPADKKRIKEISANIAKSKEIAAEITNE
jgi:predicted Zn-dependent protease